MPNALMDIQIIPKVEDLDDLYPTVDATIALVASTGLPYEVGALGTTVEGDLVDLMDLARRMNELVVERGYTSVISQIRVYLGRDPIAMDDLTAKFRS